MKEKLLKIQGLIDDIRYQLTRSNSSVEDEAWNMLNEASKTSAELVISFDEAIKLACEEYIKRELNTDATNENV